MIGERPAGIMRCGVRASAEALERRVLLAEAHHWPIGSEFQVNTYTTLWQSAPRIATNDSGDFVIAWQSNPQDGSGYGIYAQRYNAAGVPQGAEFRVNTHTLDHQRGPAVAMDADGDFVIVWTSYGQDGAYDPGGIYAQRYNAAGAPQGTEFRVNTYTNDGQFAASVAMDAVGNFVVAWSSVGQEEDFPFWTNVYAQRFDATGVPQGGEFRVNTYTTNDQRNAAVAMDADGDFVVTWSGAGSSDDGVYAQRYNAVGEPQGSEFRVNMVSTGSPSSVAMNADGDFVIAWHRPDGGGGYLEDAGVFARRYDAAGNSLGGEFLVNTYTTEGQRLPRVAMNGDGDFVIAWTSRQQDGDDYGAYARRFSAAGVPQGNEFRVNTFTTNRQHAPSAAVDASGNFVIAWTTEEQDGDNVGVFAQRYTTFGSAEAATLGDRVWNDTNANGIQDAGEPGIAGAVVELYGAGGAQVAVATTGAGGQYGFTVLAGTSAFLRFITPDGFIVTREGQGIDDALDSDIDRVTGLTPAFATGLASSTNSTVDAGFTAPATISGSVFFDRNGDGVRNGGEQAQAGFELFADFDGDGARDVDEPLAFSGFDGTWMIVDALGGSYNVTVVEQDLWSEPAPAAVAVPVGGVVNEVHFPVRTSVPDSAHLPAGDEFPVSAPEGGDFASVAMDADGEFVIVWTGAGSGVVGQRYDAAGVPQGDRFIVSAFTPGIFSLRDPAVAIDADGDFVVTWARAEYIGYEIDWDIQARRYDAAGVPQGDEFPVNTSETIFQQSPSIAMDADGDFVIAWQSYGQDGSGLGVFAQRYNAAGAPQGLEFQVNSSTFNGQFVPSVAMAADGRFVVVWTSTHVENVAGIYGQRYDAAGVPQGTEFFVGGSTSGSQAAGVAMDADGDFAVVWVDLELFARRFNAAGVPQGAPFRVNTQTVAEDGEPALAMDANGNFVITWRRGFGEIYAQRFNAAGVPQQSEFRVNMGTDGVQDSPAIAMSSGDLVVAWRRRQIQGVPYGIYAQRYSLAPRPAVTSSDFVWQNAPQRIEFAFDGDISASLSPDDIVIENLTTGTTVSPSDIAVSWSSSTNVATFTFPTLPNGGSLPDGNYRATLLADGVFNSAGTTIAADWAVEFFFLAGDANHDGRVNLSDFNVLAANFGQSGPGIDFTKGDFNYDGIVNLRDFNLLAGRFGTVLAPAVPSSGHSPFGHWTIQKDRDDESMEVLR